MHWEQSFPKGKGAQEYGIRERSIALQLRGLGHSLKEEYAAAITAFRESLELRQRLSAESEDVVIALHQLANAERASRDYVSAERDYREALRVASMVGFSEAVAACTGNLAGLALERKDWPRAEKFAREALPLSEMLGRQELIAIDCERVAIALLRQGKATEGLPYAQRAVDIYTRLNSPNLESARATLRECEAT